MRWISAGVLLAVAAPRLGVCTSGPMAAFEGYGAAMKQGDWQLAATYTAEGVAQEMLAAMGDQR